MYTQYFEASHPGPLVFLGPVHKALPLRINKRISVNTNIFKKTFQAFVLILKTALPLS